MGDGSRITIRLAAQEEDDSIAHIEAGVLIQTLSGIGDSVTDKDDRGRRPDGRRIEHREEVRSVPGHKRLCCGGHRDAWGCLDASHADRDCIDEGGRGLLSCEALLGRREQSEPMKAIGENGGRASILVRSGLPSLKLGSAQFRYGLMHPRAR